MQVFTNKIIIECPQGIASYWKTGTQIASLFTNNDLILRIPHTKYSPVKEGNNSVNYLKGVTTTTIQTSTVFIGFRCQIDDSREDLLILIRELANYSVGNGQCAANPLTIKDYHYRHDRSDRQQGYRTRYGTFKGEISTNYGAIAEGTLACDGTETAGGGYRTDGFGFKFMEVNPVQYL